MIRYLSSLKRSFGLTLVLFFGTITLGFLLGDSFGMLWSYLEEFVQSIPENNFILFFIIFGNNTIKSFLAMIFGAFFCVIPVLFIAFNGLVIGVASSFIVDNSGLRYLLIGLMPHGVIEIPMVLLSAAVGINLGLESIRKIKSKDGDVKRELTKGLKLFSVLILPLLFVAALIESFITPFLLP